MRVSEVFSSIQGEGIHMGRRATFVRLVGCNVRCAWCDTLYAMGGGKELSVDELADKVYEYSDNLLIFTGGEPMLQIDAIEEWMVAKAPGTWCTIALETNGTIDPGVASNWFDHVAVSPKLTSAGVKKWDIEILKAWCDSADSIEFKFVVTSDEDLLDVEQLTKELHLLQYGIPIILQPDGRAEPYAKALEELVKRVEGSRILKNHAQILPQLHRVIWGKEARGV